MTISHIVDLDDRDLMILEAFQRDAAISQRALGQLVGLSAAAVQRRMKRLKRDGIIARQIGVLNFAVAEPNKIFAVEASGRGLDLHALYAAAKADDRIQQCYVLEDGDLLLMVVSKSASEAKQVVQLAFGHPIDSSELMVRECVEQVKRTLSVPVERADSREYRRASA